MTLNESEINAINQENKILEDVIFSIDEQLAHYKRRSQIESERSRELTSKLVATRRDEDRQMLASDEAVSRILDTKNVNTLKSLDKLRNKPYFARIVLHEEKQNGEIKEIEYKLGFAANPDCRIIDWRKAPISKLFYEYKEGDEYSEEIQNIERNGRIALRNTLEIDNAELVKISCVLGEFEKTHNGWIKTTSGRQGLSRNAKAHLPSVLSLITAEQFQSITENASTAILIQGVAGSGKTTVALHRLSWLLGEGNSDIQGQDCIILTQTNSLKVYVENSLPQLEIEGVKVMTIAEWTAKIIAQIAPQYVNSSGSVCRPQTPCPSSIERLKRSIALLNCIEEIKITEFSSFDYGEMIATLLSHADIIIQHDETKLIDRELIKRSLERSIDNYNNNTLDLCDEAILVRLYQRYSGSLPRINGSSEAYKHIIIDEVQDINAVELASIVNSVNNTKNLTIVGDTSQQIDALSTFPGWDKLRKFWDQKDIVSKYVHLNVSHRSTLPIMKLADYIQGRQIITQGRQGRVPIWFKCDREPKAVKTAINWLNTALDKYPGSLTAVVCANEQEAKYVLSLLKPTFSELIRLGNSSSFSFDAGIVVCPIKEIKGLEFFNVLMWNVSEKNYPSEDNLSKNLFYIGITRAEENLCLISHGKPSTFLPPINSPLIRCFIVRDEIEEDSN
jgi:DNA helicase II / ATP-dependent DNA helicase PcrA